MTLSRHFYNLDEVLYALSYSISSGKKEEAIFWCKELIDSGYIGETISMLFKTWLWNYGSFNISWLIEAYDKLCSNELNEDDILLATFQLVSICPTKRDNSLWHILVLGTKFNENPPDRITNNITKKWSSDNQIETFFVQSIYQGKSLNAWWASQMIDCNRVWELLEWFCENVYSENLEKYKKIIYSLQNYENILGYKSENYDAIIRCQAILSFCSKYKINKEIVKMIPVEIADTIDIWNTVLGKKERRKYQIPKICLYGNVERGWMKWSQTSLNELYDVEKGIIGCPFWDEILIEYAEVNLENNEVVWKSDELKEKFYNNYFPDDIPDEWNKQDKNKSHGDGVLGPTENVNILKYSRNNFSKKCRLIWDKSRLSNSYLKDIIIDDCELSNIINYYTHQYIDKINLNLLKPCKKILKFNLIK